MRVIEIEKLPVYEGAVIPKGGFGIYGETANVVKLDDLKAIEDKNCYNCDYRGKNVDGGRCRCYFFGEMMYLNDFCTKWKKDG